MSRYPIGCRANISTLKKILVDRNNNFQRVQNISSGYVNRAMYDSKFFIFAAIECAVSASHILYFSCTIIQQRTSFIMRECDLNIFGGVLLANGGHRVITATEVILFSIYTNYIRKTMTGGIIPPTMRRPLH